jgi:hypothetical protein
MRLTLMLAVAACGGSTKQPVTTAPPPTTSTTTALMSPDVTASITAQWQGVWTLPVAEDAPVEYLTINNTTAELYRADVVVAKGPFEIIAPCLARFEGRNLVFRIAGQRQVQLDTTLGVRVGDSWFVCTDDGTVVERTSAGCHVHAQNAAPIDATCTLDGGLFIAAHGEHRVELQVDGDGLVRAGVTPRYAKQSRTFDSSR